jgi:MFS family permease
VTERIAAAAVAECVHFTPVDTITPADIAAGKRALIHDGAWANVVGALTSGVLLVGFALALGASDQIIGILAAIPFITQLAQLPAIRLIAAIRRRKLITIVAPTAGRALLIPIALLPFLPDRDTALVLLIAGQLVFCALGAIGGCGWNSWIHDLLPKQGLGDFFAKRLFWSTGLGMAASLLGGWVIDQAPSLFGGEERKVYAYSIVTLLGAAAGFASSWWLTKVSEPRMRPVDKTAKPALLTMLRAPLSDRNFRRVIIFMVAWNFATNLAAPFIPVYVVQQLGYDLSFVVLLAVLSQLANVATLHWWGLVADRFALKSMLAVAAPVFLACIFALPYTHTPERHDLTMPMLVVLHLLMGAAAAGVGLGTGTIGIKLAREEDATAYLAAMGLCASLAAGIAPIVGGALSQWFADKELSLLLNWQAAGAATDVVALRLRHWDFFFALAFLLGLYAVFRLDKITEVGEADQREVARGFMIEAQRSIRNLSTVAGLRVLTRAPLGRLASGGREDG